MGKLELLDTVELMCSEDYRDRFAGEYIQTKIRYEKLKAFNTKIEAARRTASFDEGVQVKEPKHDCPAGLLCEQQAAMGEYLHLLEVRAVIEDIDVEDVISSIENGKLKVENYTSSTVDTVPLPQGEGLKITLEAFDDDEDIIIEAVARIIEKGLFEDSDEEKIMLAASNILYKTMMRKKLMKESDLSSEEIKKLLKNCISEKCDCDSCPAGQALKDLGECGEYLMRLALGCIEKLEEAKNGKAKD